MSGYRERIAFARERLGVSIAGDEYELKVLRKRVTELEAALRGLIRMNEEHNAAVETVIGRPPNWSDTYLDEARAALAAGGAEEEP